NPLNLFDAIRVRDSQFVDSVDHPCITSSHGIKPAAAALSSRCRAKLSAQVVKHLRQLRVLSRQRSFANTRRVGLHRANYTIHPMRWHTGTRAGTARCRVRRSHVWISAVIDVEECPLCTFKKDFFAPLDRAMEIHDRVSHDRPQFFASRQITFVYLSTVDWLPTDRLQDSVVLN